MTNEGLTVVVGGKGKTGYRVVDRLQQLGRSVRAVSPSADVAFDWHAPRTWERPSDHAPVIATLAADTPATGA